nr:unnamed protein product [Spirometra erinaceieuropaei]
MSSEIGLGCHFKKRFPVDIHIKSFYQPERCYEVTSVLPVVKGVEVQGRQALLVYSRERDPAETQTRWRIRVQLKNDDGTPTNEQFPTRHSLLLYLGKTIPLLKSRHSGGQGSDQAAYKGKKGKRR